jgi:hypothetical protein
VVGVDAEPVVTRLQPAATIRHLQLLVAMLRQAVMPLQDEVLAEAVVDAAVAAVEDVAGEAAMLPRRRLRHQQIPYRH